MQSMDALKMAKGKLEEAEEKNDEDAISFCRSCLATLRNLLPNQSVWHAGFVLVMQHVLVNKC